MLTDAHSETKCLISMLNDADVLSEGMSRLTEKHFTGQNRQVYGLMRALYEDGKPVTPITIASDCLKIQGFRLTDIMQNVFVTKGEIGFLCDRLEDARQGNEVGRIFEQASRDIRDMKTCEVLDSVTEKLCAVGMSVEQEEVLSAKELAVRAINHVENRKRKESRNAIYTQWAKLNRITGGFEPGDLVIISAPTGKGKSAFSQNIACSLAVRQTIPCLYINSEMSEEQMSLRWAAMLAQDDEVTHSKLRAGEITEEQQEKVTDGLNRLYSSRFACVTVPDLQMDKVSSIVRRYQKKFGCKAVIVDYIGRMDTTDGKLREDQVLLNAAKRLKTLAQQTKTVMFMVAQVRKDGQLQSATYMENECDLHLRLEPLDEDGQWNYKVHISKGRNCQTGYVMFNFVGEKLTFRGES